jgi:ribosomal protein S10
MSKDSKYFTKYSIKFNWSITLPTRKRIYCVLRSPHVDKDSREHFEIRIHKRILEIYYDSEVPIFDLLSEADLPSYLEFFIVFVYLIGNGGT